MYSFFESIFSKVTSVIASVLITVGLVSGPAVSEEPITIGEPFPEEWSAEPAVKEQNKGSEDDLVLSELEKLRQEVASLKSSSKNQTASVVEPRTLPSAPTTPSAPVVPATPPVTPPVAAGTPASQSVGPQTITLPSGVTIELDADGKVVGSSDPSYSDNPNIIKLPNGSLVELGPNGEIVRYLEDNDTVTSGGSGLEVTSVDVSPSLREARITWYTNKSATSKIAVTGNNFSKKEFTTASDTRHTVTVDGLSEDSAYSYTIEADDSTVVAKKTGEFRTKALQLKGTPYVYIQDSSKEYFLYFETQESGDISTTIKFKDAGSTVTGDFSTSGKVHTVKLGSEIETEIQRLLDEAKSSALVVTLKFKSSSGSGSEYTLATDNPAIKF
jgi:hypothetical protein